MDDASHNSRLFRSEFLDIRDRVKDLLNNNPFCDPFDNSCLGGAYHDDESGEETGDNDNNSRFFATVPSTKTNDFIVVFDSPNIP
jgi:hypothetical protein